MNPYDSENLKMVSTIERTDGKLYINVSDVKPIKIHGVRFLIFKHVDKSSCQTETDCVKMDSIINMRFMGRLV